jgi:hypothetical protein
LCRLGWLQHFASLPKRHADVTSSETGSHTLSLQVASSAIIADWVVVVFQASFVWHTNCIDRLDGSGSANGPVAGTSPVPLAVLSSTASKALANPSILLNHQPLRHRMVARLDKQPLQSASK